MKTAPLLLFIFAILFPLLAKGQLPIELNAPDAAITQTGWHQFSMEVDGFERWTLIYVPTGYEPGNPVVFLFHGGTQSMRKLYNRFSGASREWPFLAEKHGFLLVTPNGMNPENNDGYGDNQLWNDVRPKGARLKSYHEDVAFFAVLLEKVKERYEVNPDAVFVTGASNGGAMSMRLLMELSDRITAGASSIFNLPRTHEFVQVPAVPTPFMILNGTRDPIVPWGGDSRMLSAEETANWWAAANNATRRTIDEKTIAGGHSAGCQILLTVFEGDDNSAPVWFYEARGAGHVGPSKRHRIPASPRVERLLGPQCDVVETAELIWEFFRQFL